MAASQRVPHALLFVGPPGIGKKKTAFAFLQALNCERELGEGCGSCRCCERIERLTHPDVLLVSPDGGAIKIGQVREVISTLSLRPLEARWRAVVVDGAELMTKEAANAFLKTLEEPPPQVVIILVASRLDALPLTVSSRCQIVKFSPLRDEEVEEVLGRLGVEDRGLVALAEGSPGRALELGESREMGEMLQKTLRGGIKEVLEVGERLGRDREGAKKFLGLLLKYIRGELEQAEEETFDVFWEVLRAYRSLDENANVRLSLEGALFALHSFSEG